MRAMPFLLLLAAAMPSRAAEDAWVAEARSVAAAMPPKLSEVLADAIASSGPEGAIGVCREKAPQMAQAASDKSGWQIRRVSLRNRNPKAVPDAWEQAVLADFDRRVALGESAATMERADVVPDASGASTWRYMRGLPTQEMCTACHGLPEKLNAEVAAKLRDLYPNDRATGYVAGTIRGAISLKKSIP